MKPFGYQRPGSRAEAVRTVREHAGAAYLAGGTNLVDHLRLGITAPDLLVDIADLGLDTVTGSELGLSIGAGVRNSDLAADLRVRREYPALSRALLSGASGQLRNMATVGGNLLQRTRCPYFQDRTLPCNKREHGTGCPARTGAHKDLAVLGGSTACIATHPSDMAVALAALDAVVVVQGLQDLRRLSITEFYRLPGDLPSLDTVLDHGELVVAVELPPPTRLTRSSSYRKARDRASFAFALASVAIAADVEDGRLADVRIAFGSVASRPWRAFVAEDILRCGPIDPTAFDRAIRAELEQAQPLPGNAYKVELVRRLAVSELTAITGAGAARSAAG